MREFLTKHKWLLIVSVAAILVRLVYLFELSRLPGFLVPMVDEKWHWLWAQDILNKSFWGDTAYFRAPLYPYFLALLVKLTGSSIFWSKLLQILLTGGTACFIYKLTSRIFNQTTAIIAGFIYAFYSTLIFYESMFMIPVLFLFFLVWGMYRLIAYQNISGWKRWLFTGIIFGLASISRPNILLVIPFLMLWMFFTAINKTSILSRAKLPLVMLFGVVIMIAPVTIRNAIVTGDFILISSQGGINLYLGNNEVADGLTMLMPEVDLDESVTWRQFGEVTKAAAEREAGKSLSDAEQSSFWTAKAVDFILENPGKFLTLLWKKTVYLFSGFENSDNADIYYQRNKSVLFSILLWHKLIYFPFGLLLPLTVMSLYIRREDFKKLLPLYIFLLAYIPSIVLFLVTARHRLPLLPFMIIIASAGLTTLISRIKLISLKQSGIAIILFIIPLLVFNHTYYNEGKGSDFQIHFNNGIKYEHLNDFEKAEEEYLLADKSYPFSASLINNLAFVQYRLNKYNLADSNYHRAIKLKPDFGPAYHNLGLLLQKKSNLDSAIILYKKALRRYKPTAANPHELSQIYLSIADMYETKGNIDSASICYQEGLKAGPDFYKAYFKAAAFYARHGIYDFTDTLYTSGRRLQDLSANDYFNWGLSHIERKQYSIGIAMMFSAIKRDESLFQAYYCIAVGYYENKYPPDSVNKYLNLCFQYNPDYKPAVELKNIMNKNK